jgi:hypothetical protein
MNNLSAVGAFVGTVVQMLGLIIALVAGVVATMQNYQTRSPDMAR